MMKRVLIDPGHGGNDPGATYRDLKEKDINLQVAAFTYDELMKIDSDIWCGLTRTWDRTISLQERCGLANAMNVDCFVSIHCNADPDPDAPGMPEARGEEIWIYKRSREGLKLALELMIQVDRIFPLEPFRGIKETENFYVLKHTKAPAALIEIGFIDKESSRETFSSIETLQRIETLIARGVYNYLSNQKGERR
jgi:N-acetylmuramoyl-L-alanine amidase